MLTSLEVKEVGLKIKVDNTRFIAYILSVLSHVLEQRRTRPLLIVLGSSAVVFLRDGISDTGYWNNPWLPPNIRGPAAKPTAVESRLHK